MGIFDFTGLFGMSGRAIYHNFRGGTGDDGRGMSDASDEVVNVVKNYAKRTESITRLTGKMEGAWQGGAAGAARRGAGPLAVEHGLAQPEMMTAQATLTNQVHAFRGAQHAVTEVPPTPQKPGFWDNVGSFGGAGRNYESKMTEYNAANDHNVAVMEAYEDTTDSNTTRMPTSYGRITPDHSAVGVQQPTSPPPHPLPYEPPPNPNGNDGRTPGNNNFTSSNQNNTDPSQSQFQQQTGNNNQNQNQTNPSDFRPTPPVEPPRNLPPGQGPGQGPGQPGLPGFMPPGPAGFGPTGSDGGRGGYGRGGGFGPGGSGGGAGGSGSGSGSGARGPGSGFGPGGAAAAAEGAAGRGGLGGGGRGMGMGGGGMGGGRGNQGEDDAEHERPTFLVEPDPHDTFGTDEVTAPPVIGE